MGFHSGSVGKNPPAMWEMQETQVQSLGQEDRLEEDVETTPVSLPGESHGQRSLVDYSLWGRKRVRHNLATKNNNSSVVGYMDF